MEEIRTCWSSAPAQRCEGVALQTKLGAKRFHTTACCKKFIAPTRAPPQTYSQTIPGSSLLTPSFRLLRAWLRFAGYTDFSHVNNSKSHAHHVWRTVKVQ